jgi:hypothetical protein
MEARSLPHNMRAEITAYYSDVWTRHTGAHIVHPIAEQPPYVSDKYQIVTALLWAPSTGSKQQHCSGHKAVR